MMLWPLAIVLAVGLVLVVALLTGAWLFPGTRPTTRAFWCPFQQRDVVVEFRETAWDGRRVDVSRCTFFSPPTAITCPKGCVGLEQFLPARGSQAPSSSTPAV